MEGKVPTAAQLTADAHAFVKEKYGEVPRVSTLPVYGPSDEPLTLENPHPPDIQIGWRVEIMFDVRGEMDE